MGGARRATILLLPILLTSSVSAAPLCNYYLFEVPDADSVLMQLWYVIDGDTVRLANGTYVRLVGYDSYELSEAMGPEAKQALENLCWAALQGIAAALDVDDLEPRDTYGRLLGYLWCPYIQVYFEDGSEMLDWVNVNKWFLTLGSQYVKRQLYVPPDEHPYWVWLTQHNISLPYLSYVKSYSQPILAIARNQFVEIRSGRYAVKAACRLCDTKYYGVAELDLVSDVSKSVQLELSLHLIVVRGFDNRIYYALCNASACGAWALLPGSTPAAPSIVVNRERSRVYIAVRGMDNGIYFGYFDVLNQTFRGWMRLSGSTPSKPTLVSDRSGSIGDGLVLIVRGMNNGIYYNVFNESSFKWSGWKHLPGSTVDAPAAVIAEGKLHIVVRGGDGRSLWYAYLDLGSWAFRSWTRLPGSTPSTPSMASDGYTVWLAVRGMDNRIYINSLAAGSWSGWRRVPTGSAAAGPAIELIDGPVLHLAVTGSDGRSIWYTQVYTNGTQLLSWNRIPGSSPSSPALAQIPP